MSVSFELIGFYYASFQKWSEMSRSSTVGPFDISKECAV